MWEPSARAGSVHDTDSETGIEEQEMERREGKRETEKERAGGEAASLKRSIFDGILKVFASTAVAIHMQSISIMSPIEGATQVQTHINSAYVCVSVCVCV